MDSLNKQAITSYFELLGSVDNNLTNSAGQIYVDESGMSLNHCTPKVVTQ